MVLEDGIIYSGNDSLNSVGETGRVDVLDGMTSHRGRERQ
jgi:hypothetical protein